MAAPINAMISQRFGELADQAGRMPVQGQEGFSLPSYDSREWRQWATSAAHLIELAFGVGSTHSVNFKLAYAACNGIQDRVDGLKGIFDGARADYDAGYAFSLEARITGEIFGDFVTLAKRALNEDAKDVAAVLACAALEDALKKLALRKKLDVANKEMQQVVNALKSAGAVTGAQKSLLDSMPKIRDYAMHANWQKITPQDVGGVIGFVEQLLLQEFS